MDNHLKELEEIIRKDGRHVELTRQFVKRFDAERRGKHTVAEIRSWLDAHSLRTMPDFENSWFDGEIIIQPESKKKGQGKVAFEAQRKELLEKIQPIRIGILNAANQTPVSIKKEESIDVAFTRMLTRDFSQLPVMPNDYNVDGMINMASLLRKQLGPLDGAVGKYMEPPEVVQYNESILDVLPKIISHNAVMVKKEDGTIKGPITTADLSLQFQITASPFLLLQEIEVRLRALIDSVFSPGEIKSAIRSFDTDRPEVDDVNDLTIADYIFLLNSSKCENFFARPLSRSEIISQLERVRGIRNNVMHFAPEPLGNMEMNALRQIADFLKLLVQSRIASV